MKNITERHDIATAIKLSGKPVITIDLDKREYLTDGEDSWTVRGNKIRVARQYKGETYYDCATPITYGDGRSEGHAYSLMAPGFSICADFGYYDVVEAAEWAQAPIVHEGDHIIVVELHSKTKGYAVKEGIVTLNNPFVTPAGYID